MSEVLFYHLEHASLEDVLPGLLERTRGKGWKALVRCGSQERCDALDAHLWIFRDDSFLAHGLANGPLAEEQPVLLTEGRDNLNQAQVLFLVDGADAHDWADNAMSALARVVVIFDGRDPQAVEQARAQWKTAKASGHEVTYWQQASQGKWEKRA